MKLMTKEIQATLPNIGATGELEADKVKVLLKLFDPCGRFTYYATEFDPSEGLLFGYCVSPLGEDCDELGYASLAEIESIKVGNFLRIERDIYWNPETTLEQVMNGEVR